MNRPEHENHNPIDSGFFTSSGLEPQKPPFTMIKAGPLVSRINEYFPDGTPVWAKPEPAKSAALSYRLVKAPKCPTHKKPPEKFTDAWFHELKFKRISENAEKARKREAAEKWFVEKGIKTAEESEQELNEAYRSKLKTAPMELSGVDTKTGEILPRAKQGTNGQLYTVVTFREWSQEYRIRTETDQCSAKPPEQTGERESVALSMNGAKKIADSCHFMHLKKGGYKTFLTLTIEPEKREQLEAGEITIQKEIGRFWDAMNKVRQRGFSYTMPKGEKRRIKGVSGRNIRYCWVIENPLNKAGERNPHVHILMDWGVPYGPQGCIFKAWADRVERIWKNGFAHLEKMKDTANAGAYMAKAAGYLSKAAGESDQGPVKGNRYGISKDSRAPDWVQVGRYEAGHMGHLIKDVHDYFSHVYGHVFAKRKKLNAALEKLPKTEKKERHKIGKALAKVRKKCNELPAVAGKYQLLIKGREKFNEFMAWASSADSVPASEWLPEKEAGEEWDGNRKRPDCNWFREYQLRLFNRKAKRRWERMDYEPFAAEEVNRPEPEKPSVLDWLKYQKWGVAA